MNDNERRSYSEKELRMGKVPINLLLRGFLVKFRRRLLGWKDSDVDSDERMVWGVSEVSDAQGPTDNVRNYLERRTIRTILTEIASVKPIKSAAEVGCGYGRIIMVLTEFAESVVGFERENELLSIARPLLPAIDFCQCDNLNEINQHAKGEFDFMMTCTVLQHLTDERCKMVLGAIKQAVASGHVLLVEKTEMISVTSDVHDEKKFMSIARTVETYAEWMKPFELVKTVPRVVEPTYFNKSPGMCMLFKSPRGNR